MPDIKILEKQALSNKRSRLEKIKYEIDQNGHSQTHEREVFFRPPSASILLYDSDRKTVILTKQFRLPVYLDKKEPILEACAGLLDEGEFPEHAIVREVEEETGYRISEIEKVAEGYTSPSSFSEYAYFFLGKYSPDMRISEGGGLKDEGEDVQVIELSAEEVKQKLKSGQVRDIKTLVLLQHALLHNLI